MADENKPAAPWWVPDTKGFLAVFIVGSFVVAIFSMIFAPPMSIPPEISAIINMLLGALVAKFGTVVDFNFGSSQGSKDKDDTQNKVVRDLATATATAVPAIVAPGMPTTATDATTTTTPIAPGTETTTTTKTPEHPYATRTP